MNDVNGIPFPLTSQLGVLFLLTERINACINFIISLTESLGATLSMEFRTHKWQSLYVTLFKHGEHSLFRSGYSQFLARCANHNHSYDKFNLM